MYMCLFWRKFARVNCAELCFDDQFEIMFGTFTWHTFNFITHCLPLHMYIRMHSIVLVYVYAYKGVYKSKDESCNEAKFSCGNA